MLLKYNTGLAFLLVKPFNEKKLIETAFFPYLQFKVYKTK